uniref:Uncharacterized protein n=1 Tax=Rhizophora mucronata TaxID=61149 RepID=A0A2P2KAI5_RHIMU
MSLTWDHHHLHLSKLCFPIYIDHLILMRHLFSFYLLSTIYSSSSEN